MFCALLGVAGAFAVFWLLPGQRYRVPEPIRIDVPAGIVIGLELEYRGDLDATITLVEFGDYECPSCRVAEQEVKRRIETNDPPLKFVFRHAPTNVHPLAEEAARVVETARVKGRFWEAHDRLLAMAPPLGNQRYNASTES